jgi:hypothetical protein
VTLDPTTRPDIGIVGLPDVAAALRSAGLVVVGGGPFGDVAKTIRQHLDGGMFPILSTAEAAPGLRTWLSAQAGKGVEVGLVPVSGSELAVAGASVLDLPCAVDDLVCALGLDPIGGPVGSAEVSLDGTVSGFDFPAAPPPVPSPATAPAAAPAGPWDDGPAVPVTEPVTEPAETPFEAPAPDEPVQPAAPVEVTDPAPVEPVPPAEPVSVVDDDFPVPVAAVSDDDDDDLVAPSPAAAPSAVLEPIPEAIPEPEPAPLPAPPHLGADPWGGTQEPAPPVAPPPPPASVPAPVPAPLPDPPVVEAPPAPAPPPPPPAPPAPPAAPAAQPVAAPAPPAPPAPADDIEDVFDQAVTAPASIEPARHRAASDCPVIFVIAGKGGVGKAVALDTLVPTPDGFQTIADLTAGDSIFGRDGKPCTVTAVFDHEDLVMYDVFLSDGQVIRACEDHRWVVSDHYRRVNQATDRKADKSPAIMLRAFADQIANTADGFDEDDHLLGRELWRIASAIPGCPWTSEAAMRSRLTGIAASLSHHRSARKVKLYPTSGLLQACATTWAGTLADPSLRRLHERTAAALDALCRVESGGGLATSLTTADLVQAIQNEGGPPSKAAIQRALRKVALAGHFEHRAVPHTRNSTTGYPARLALKTLAQAASSRLEDGPAPLEEVLTTAAMVERGVKVRSGAKATSNFAIAVTEPLAGPHRSLPVDPYVLGVWLGDGTTASGRIDQGAEDQQHIISALVAAGYSCDQPKGTRIGTKGLKVDLRTAGVLGNKHIPAQYLRASKDQRLALLQGLMDTDGTVADDGGCELSLCDERLAADAIHLIRSLGIKCAMTSGPATITEMDPDSPGSKRRRVTGTRWRMNFTTTTPVFRLPRKASLIKDEVRATQGLLYVTDIVPAGRAPGRCLTVDSVDHTFLVADHVPTHNTTFTAQLGQRAGEAGLRAVVVDANRGQADITTYLRLGRAGLPTIADAAGSGRYEQAILAADRLNGSRHQRLEPVSFSAILGPPPEKSDPRLVTADVYRQMISLARRDADVIVVDTQIAEATDTSGLIDGLVVPMLAEGAWALAVTDLSTASVKNLHGILGRWRERTVPRDRVLLAVNRADPSTTVDQVELGQAFANVADFVGLVHSNPEMTASLNRGAVRPSAPELLTVLDTVLHRVTGFDEFDPSLHAVAQTSLMDRLRRRRGR